MGSPHNSQMPPACSRNTWGGRAPSSRPRSSLEPSGRWGGGLSSGRPTARRDVPSGAATQSACASEAARTGARGRVAALASGLARKLVTAAWRATSEVKRRRECSVSRSQCARRFARCWRAWARSSAASAFSRLRMNKNDAKNPASNTPKRRAKRILTVVAVGTRGESSDDDVTCAEAKGWVESSTRSEGRPGLHGRKPQCRREEGNRTPVRVQKISGVHPLIVAE